MSIGLNTTPSPNFCSLHLAGALYLIKPNFPVILLFVCIGTVLFMIDVFVLFNSIVSNNASICAVYDLSFIEDLMLTVFPKPLTTVKRINTSFPSNFTGAAPVTASQPSSVFCVSVSGLASALYGVSTNSLHLLLKSFCASPALGELAYMVITQKVPAVSFILV